MWNISVFVQFLCDVDDIKYLSNDFLLILAIFFFRKLIKIIAFTLLQTDPNYWQLNWNCKQTMSGKKRKKKNWKYRTENKRETQKEMILCGASISLNCYWIAAMSLFCHK